ncbi:MAG: hypothetical protein ACLUD2_05320 [Clostridium sp.]
MERAKMDRATRSFWTAWGWSVMVGAVMGGGAVLLRTETAADLLL